ncbi:hypothetical protein M8C21_003405 [Ambrosia artemisiifolia]|uniref:Uncharacterized protein n=1 Tax=Ambrosia artemisiifolia TaxID=4212 RepID=A0AAD5C3F0_AMBAR|nr:hypothetical protein M8C21_003405 [Ambrosia artemisiifolia]
MYAEGEARRSTCLHMLVCIDANWLLPNRRLQTLISVILHLQVRSVRETMNKMIEAWNAIPDVPQENGLAAPCFTTTMFHELASDVGPNERSPNLDGNLKEIG